MRLFYPEFPDYDNVKFILLTEFPGYAVSDNGLVWSCLNVQGNIRDEWKKLKYSFAGTSAGVILKNIYGNRIKKTVNSLILTAFKGKPNTKLIALNINEDINDHRLTNLVWGSFSDAVEDRRTWTDGKIPPTNYEEKLYNLLIACKQSLRSSGWSEFDIEEALWYATEKTKYLA